MVIQFKERRDATKHVQGAPRELILCPGALWFHMIRKQLPLLRLNCKIPSSMPLGHDLHSQLGQSFRGKQFLFGGSVWWKQVIKVQHQCGEAMRSGGGTKTDVLSPIYYWSPPHKN